jgi:transposase InsO family protein
MRLLCRYTTSRRISLSEISSEAVSFPDDEWAYLQPYTSNTERTAALTDFLHTYNHHRSHTALGGQPPISRVNNPAGQYT